MSKYDRFDLETEIHSVWDTEKDLDTILYRLLDSSDGPCSEDEIANMIIGLKEIHKSRCLKKSPKEGSQVVTICDNLKL